MFAPKNILVPTDFSEYSGNALSQAIDIAKQYKSKIYLLHVVGMIKQCFGDYCLRSDTVQELEEQSIAAAGKMLQEEVAKNPDSKSVEIVTVVQEGSPYEVILKEQQERNIDLIVIASHGRTGLLHFFMGSIADKITKRAKCPVLLLRS